MRYVPLVILMSSFVAPSPLYADAITGSPTQTATAEAQPDGQQDRRQDSDSQSTPAFGASALFDAAGFPLLHVAPPQYLNLGPHEKVRNLGGPLVSGEVLSGLSSGVNSASISNVSFSSGGGSGSTPQTTPTATPEPASLLLFGSGLVLAARQLRKRRVGRTA